MRDLVLVGAGHAHVQVLHDFALRPPPDVRLTLVVDRAQAVYSGMVPGFVAGDYEASELEIDAVALARRAGAGVVLAAATGVMPEAGRILLEGRPPTAYDVASFDVGSSVRGLAAPGVREHALATRPIRHFVDALEARVAAARARGGEAVRVVVVGGGAAGVELAFTLEARLRAEGTRPRAEVLTDAQEILPAASAALVRKLRREAARRGIALRTGVRVDAVERDRLRLAGGGEELPCDLAVWATGAAAPRWLADSGLPTDEAGFLRVGETLQVEGHPELFAAGDAAALVGHPWVPKAGVYAVRQGPVLTANLRAFVAQGSHGGRLRRYHPQRDFLALLNLGERRAVGGKWGLAVSGHWVWRLKDAIDRRFVRRFQGPGPESRGGVACPRA